MRNGWPSTVHQPVLSASASGRNDVISTPAAGIIHSRTTTMMVVRVNHPPLRTPTVSVRDERVVAGASSVPSVSVGRGAVRVT